MIVTPDAAFEFYDCVDMWEFFCNRFDFFRLYGRPCWQRLTT